MTQVTNDMLKNLSEKFSYKEISWRAGDVQVTREDGVYAAALPYIDARDVQNRLDEVVGPENWKSEFVISPQGHIICRLSIFHNGQWISKEDGSAIESGTRAREFSAKTGFSDALKRAAVAWGIGRYLYAYRAEYVKLANDKATLSYIPALPPEFLPESERAEVQDRVATPKVVVASPATTPVTGAPVVAPVAEAKVEVKPEVVATKVEAATPAASTPVVETKVVEAVEDIPATKPVNTPEAKKALEAALGAEPKTEATAPALPVLDAAQTKVFDNLITRIDNGLSANMLKGFITAATTNLTQEARDYLLRKIDEREAKKA